MSNTLDSNPHNSNSGGALQVEVQLHLEDEPVPLPSEASLEIVRAVRQTLVNAGVVSGAVEVAVVNDTVIHEVNRQHLAHDWETDVITFPYNFSEAHVEGELIVSWETAVREAMTTGWPPLTELLLYCIHGTLHLLGFDDLDAASRLQMRERERVLLKQLGLFGGELYDVDSARSGVADDRQRRMGS